MSTLLVSSKDFRQHFPKYQKLVEKGVSITILKRSKPIFRIEPVDTKREEEITKALLDYEDIKDKNFVAYDDIFSEKA